jgi:hypothetical protein
MANIQSFRALFGSTQKKTEGIIYQIDGSFGLIQAEPVLL